MLARGIDFWAKKEGYDRIFTGDNYNPFHQFPCYLSGECILFANLESQFSKKANEKVENTFLFRANTGSIKTLLDIQGGNQLLLSLANNHTSNAGGEGVRTTRATLHQHGI
jgi:bacterial capsule synthesis protein